MKRLYIVAFVVAVASGCAGGIPAVPPMEFRVNSPAPTPSVTTVNDNHQEVNQNLLLNNTSVVYAPIVYAPVVQSPAPAEPPPAQDSEERRMVEFLGIFLRGAAERELPGMQPASEPFGGSVTEGQVITQRVILQPGKCYTVVALGSMWDIDVAAGTTAGVTELPSDDSPRAIPRICLNYSTTEIALRAAGAGVAVGQLFVR